MCLVQVMLWLYFRFAVYTHTHTKEQVPDRNGGEVDDYIGVDVVRDKTQIQFLSSNSQSNLAGSGCRA